MSEGLGGLNTPWQWDRPYEGGLHLLILI